jgi:hypothetical protein
MAAAVVHCTTGGGCVDGYTGVAKLVGSLNDTQCDELHRFAADYVKDKRFVVRLQTTNEKTSQPSRVTAITASVDDSGRPHSTESFYVCVDDRILCRLPFRHASCSLRIRDFWLKHLLLAFSEYVDLLRKRRD